MQKILLALGLAALVMTGACKKKNEDPVTRSGLLVAGKWQVISYEDVIVDDKGNTTRDTYSYDDMKTCERDDYWIFSADGRAVVDEGATKCAEDDPQISYDGTWKLLNNDTQFELEDESDSILFEIEEVSASTFKVYWTDQISKGKETFTMTFQNIK